ISGNWYDGYASRWSGNVDSATTNALIYFTGDYGTRRTRVVGLHFEGRDKTHNTVHIVDKSLQTTEANFFDIMDATWTYHVQNQRTAYPPIETYSSIVSLTNGAAVEIVNNEHMRSN